MKEIRDRLQKKENRGGFTLAELLIVVAIIAVLVAIAIPIFNNNLKRAKDATAAANLRSAYAEASAAYVSNSYKTGEVEKINDTTVRVFDVEIKAATADWSGQLVNMPFDGADQLADQSGTFSLDFKFDGGKVTLISN